MEIQNDDMKLGASAVALFAALLVDTSLALSATLLVFLVLFFHVENGDCIADMLVRNFDRDTICGMVFIASFVIMVLTLLNSLFDQF